MLKSTDVENSVPGASTVYIGEPCKIMHGASTLDASGGGKAFEIVKGTKLRVCSRPVVYSLGPPHVLVHLPIVVSTKSGHPTGCKCGNCGFHFAFADETPAECSCGTDEYDPLRQKFR